MARSSNINRRTFGLGLAAPALIGLAPAFILPAGAQTAVPATGNEAWRALGDLTSRARGLGVSSPRMTLGPTGGSVEEALPAVLELLDRLDAAIDKTSTPELQALRKDAAALRQKLNSDAKGGRSEAEPVTPGVSTGISAAEDDKKFNEYKDQYLELFKTCTVSASHQRVVTQYITRLADEKHQAAYKTVEDELCTPWYFVGLAHGMEASFDLKAHLHNGDPLDAPTVHVPANRPKPWLPPSDWASSAIDALTIEHFANKSDWSLARILYRLEAYNGWGYRKHGINSPYLWSFSNHYSSGKYVSDGNWDAGAVSSQCGAAVMLKALVDNNVVQVSA